MEDNICIVPLSGKITSLNAKEIESEIAAGLRPGTEKIIFDCSALKYTSTAGLRFILRFAQKYQVEMTEVSSDVYEMLNFAGFTKMIPVKKTHRFVSIKNSETVGSGNWGKVYSLSDDTMIKTFSPDTPISEIEDEINRAHVAFVNGLPSYIPFDVVSCEVGYGLIFEKAGKGLLNNLLNGNEDDFKESIKQYAELVKTVTSTELVTGSLPRSEEVLKQRFECIRQALPPEACEIWDSFINGIPSRNTMVHGDLHARNARVHGGELILIDLADLTIGHPIFELGSIAHKYVTLFPFLAERGIKKGAPGVDVDEGKKIWDAFCEEFFADLDASTRTDRKWACEQMGFITHVCIVTQIYSRQGGDREHFAAQANRCIMQNLAPNADRLADLINNWQ